MHSAFSTYKIKSSLLRPVVYIFFNQPIIRMVFPPPPLHPHPSHFLLIPRSLSTSTREGEIMYAVQDQVLTRNGRRKNLAYCIHRNVHTLLTQRALCPSPGQARTDRAVCDRVGRARTDRAVCDSVGRIRTDRAACDPVGAGQNRPRGLSSRGAGPNRPRRL